MGISAQELRIGNLIEYKIEDKLDERKEWWETNIVDIYYLQHMVEFPKSEVFRPIPLTDEWLLKFGFIIEDRNKECFILKEPNEYGRDYNLIQISFNRLIDKTKKEYMYSYVLNHGFNKTFTVRYVHQLQNLFFGLKGEELAQVSEGEK